MSLQTKFKMKSFLAKNLKSTTNESDALLENHTKAVINLIEKLGGKVVKVGFVMELAGFGAKDTVLKGYDVESLISYPDK